jgi:hypothetical protein
MRTFIVDLDTLSSENFRNLIGFTLRVGLNFRKIDSIDKDKTSQLMLIETSTKAEEKALSDLFDRLEIEKPRTILPNNKVTHGLKVLGTFKQLAKESNRDVFYLDKSTGKKFVIEKA